MERLNTGSGAGRFRVESREMQRFLKFAVVGVSGTLIDFAVLTLLVKGFGVPTLAANTISYSVGVVNNFLLNRYWSFAESRTKRLTTQFLQFVVVNLIALALSDFLVVTLERLLTATFHENAYVVAKLIATVLVFFWNFFANRLWTYNDVNHVKEPQ